MKRIISVLLLLTMLVSMSACEESDRDDSGCNHRYEVVEEIEATCTEKGKTVKVCKKCDKETVRTTPKVDHEYEDATCDAPKTCIMCGDTKGEALGHEYEDGQCTRCGNIEGLIPNPPVNEPGTPDVTGNFLNTPVTITFYHTMGMALQDVLDAYIAEFNKLYPNVTVLHQPLGGYEDVRDQIKTELTVGNHPNIAYCYPDHVALYNIANGVAALDEYISSNAVITRADGTTEILGLTEQQKNDFIPGFYAEGMQFGDGKMYSLPMVKSTEVLYYNKTFFEKHNLKVPTTWDEMEAVCKRIKEIDPASIPLGYDDASNWFITMCAQQGSDYTSATVEHYLFNNATNKAFVKQFREWYQKGYVTTQEIYGAYTSSLFTNLNGVRSYMCIASSAGAKYQCPAADYHTGAYAFDVGIAMIPQVNKSNPKVISQGPNLCIFNDENPNEVLASWLFMKYLTTNANFQAEFSNVSGYVPILKSVVKHPTYQQYLQQADGGNNIQWLAIKVALEQTHAYFASPAFNGSAAARDQVGWLMNRALLESGGGNIDAIIDKFFEDAVQECKFAN